MKHRWKIIGEKFDKANVAERNTKSNLVREVYNIHECIYCGLRKGNSRQWGRFMELIYYRDDKFLSRGVLPYKCIKPIKEFLLTEEEMML